MLISKFAGTPMASKIAVLFNKCTGKSMYYTDSVGGVVGKTNFKTGTHVMKTADSEGIKVITLGQGNSLRSELGITNFTVYPKGSFFGGKEGCVVYPADSQKTSWAYTLKEFGDCIKLLREVKAEGNLTA